MYIFKGKFWPEGEHISFKTQMESKASVIMVVNWKQYLPQAIYKVLLRLSKLGV